MNNSETVFLLENDITLKSCPFCGGTAETFIIIRKKNRTTLEVRCNECKLGFYDFIPDMETGMSYEELNEKIRCASEAWNKRSD